MQALPSCKCPTCGAPYQAERPLVDLDRNLFVCAAGTAHLNPQRAEILSIIASQYPRPARREALVAQLYGAQDGPTDALGLLRVQISHVRAALRPLGWAVRNFRARGYALEQITGDGE